MDNLPTDEEGKEAVATIGVSAGVGAAIGTVIPVVGTAVGAAAGGILGSAVVLYNKFKNS